jgi:transcriptional regulator with XRE-family HTH domain
MAKKKLNKIKIVLAMKDQKSKWLAQKLGKNPNTISKWCNNEAQPSLETLFQIAEVLDVEVKDLVCLRNETGDVKEK